MTLNLIELADRLESFIPRGDGYNSDYANTLAEAVEVLRAKAAPKSSLTEAQDSLYYGAIDSPAETSKPDEHACHAHPDAPHGFNRNASHTADRYVCDCEGWVPPAQPQSDAVIVPRELARRLVSTDNHVRQTARRELRNALLGGDQPAKQQEDPLEWSRKHGIEEF